METQPNIETFTGRKFYPLTPNARDVCIEDIAHALALKCRFTGHSRAFYSIAQHSILASQWVDLPRGRLSLPETEARELMLTGLMHDAAEAYLPDVAAPLKPHMRNFKAMEMMVEAAIAERFALRYPWPREVKVCDFRLLLTEARDLMHSKGEGWSWNGLIPFEFEIAPLPAAEAEKEFLKRFEELTQ